MKQRIIKLSLVLLIPITIIAALVAFGTTVEVNNTSAGADTVPPVSNDVDSSSPAIAATRLTSIPFGIDSFLPLSQDGQAVQVSGHGECPAEGDYFNIRVYVTQEGQKTRAVGDTEADCDTLPGWSATAKTLEAKSFKPGPAEVCGRVLIYGTPKGTLVGKWCKYVTLE